MGSLDQVGFIVAALADEDRTTQCWLIENNRIISTMSAGAAVTEAREDQRLFLPEHGRDESSQVIHRRDEEREREEINKYRVPSCKSLDQHPTISLRQLTNHYRRINN